MVGVSAETENFPTKESVAAHLQDRVNAQHKMRAGSEHQPDRSEPKECSCETCQPPLTGRHGQLLRRMRRRQHG